MFEILAFQEAHVASVTNRIERHGDEEKPAVSIGLELTIANTLLDIIDPQLRHALYKAVADGAQADLPEIEQSTPVLRCNSIERAVLPTRHEGWTLAVDDGFDGDDPTEFGSVKVDKLSVEPKQGGSVVLRMRLGTNDVDADKLGWLAVRNGQSIWITLTAPKVQQQAAEKERDEPDAGDLFAAQVSDDGAWPFPKGGAGPQEAPPQSATTEIVIERSQPSTRTARGREKTAKALAAGDAS